MKPNNKLNQALKDALFEHPEPLHDGQWERLRVELEEKKKRRFLPWFFLFAGVLLCAGLIHLYIKSDGDKITIQNQTANNQTNSHASDQNAADSKSNALPSDNLNTSTGSSVESAMKPEPNLTKMSRHASQSPATPYSTTVQQSINDGHGPSDNNWGLSNRLDNDINKETPSESRKDVDVNQGLPVKTKEDNITDTKSLDNVDNKDKAPQEPINKTKLVSGDGNNSKEPLKKEGDAESTKSGEVEIKEDTTKKTDTSKGLGDDKKIVKWVFGLNAGYAAVNSVVTGITNEEQLHKDSRNIFKMGNDKQSAMFYNFNVEYRFSQKIGLRLNTGLHYRLLNNNVDFTYKLSQVPVRLPDNTILTYITIPDTSNPLIFRVRENQSYSFLSIPLCLNYSLPINAHSELLLGGGVNISALIGSTGSAFSLNEMSYKQSGDMIKHPLNLGMSLSVGYSRRLMGNWWLGADFGMQSMALRYDLGYGDLKSRMNSRSLGLNIRYKLLK